MRKLPQPPSFFVPCALSPPTRSQSVRTDPALSLTPLLLTHSVWLCADSGWSTMARATAVETRCTWAASWRRWCKPPSIDFTGPDVACRSWDATFSETPTHLTQAKAVIRVNKKDFFRDFYWFSFLCVSYFFPQLLWLSPWRPFWSQLAISASASWFALLNERTVSLWLRCGLHNVHCGKRSPVVWQLNNIDLTSPNLTALSVIHTAHIYFVLCDNIESQSWGKLTLNSVFRKASVRDANLSESVVTLGF